MDESGKSAAAPSVRNTCAIVITYHPGANFAARLKPARTQVDHLILVDNGSDGPNLAMLRELNGDTIELIENSENLGVGTALNQGMGRAIELGYRWVLALDQDTEASENLMAGLAATYDACLFREKIGIVAANFVDEERHRLFVEPGSSGRGYIPQSSCITAGSLIRVEAFRQARKFRDDFFIDFVDTEYSLRLRAKSWQIIYSPRPLINHSIGAPKRHRLGFVTVATSNHSPLRRYYITRNRLVMDWAYLGKEPRAVISDLWRIAGETFLLVLFEDRKCAKLRAMYRAAIHAMTGRMGRLK